MGLLDWPVLSMTPTGQSQPAIAECANMSHFDYWDCCTVLRLLVVRYGPIGMWLFCMRSCTATSSLSFGEIGVGKKLFERKVHSAPQWARVRYKRWWCIQWAGDWVRWSPIPQHSHHQIFQGLTWQDWCWEGSTKMLQKITNDINTTTMAQWLL